MVMSKKVTATTEVKKARLVRDKNTFLSELNNRIELGRELLNTPVSRVGYSGFGYPSHSYAYDERQFNNLKSEFQKWNSYNSELLKQAFDIPNNEYRHSYIKAGQALIFTSDTDMLQMYRDEISGKILNLEALVQKLPLLPIVEKEPIPSYSEGKSSDNRQPMIFISHASADNAFVDALVRLLEGIGFDETNLFCSSIPEYGIALGESIYDKLLNLFRDKKLYVLFVHSPCYYTRPVCLNEMGAAWVLKTEYYSILTKDMSYEMMTGVVTSERIGIKVDATDASARLNELYENLKSAFSLSALSQTKWERLRNTFLSDVNAI